MRLVSFRSDGMQRLGVVKGDGIVDVGSRIGIHDLRQLLAEDRLDACALVAHEAADYRMADVAIDPVIREAAHFFCIGTNYQDHRQEVVDAGVARAPAEYPMVFTRFPETVVGHECELLKPLGTNSFDFEGELAVVIGRGGRRIPRDQALLHVAGYCCFNDGSIREWQFHTSQVTAGKNFASSGSLGPYLVTTDEIADPSNLDIETRLNGVLVQQSSTSLMIFDVPTIIAYVSTLVPLTPGDVIATGTPSGVGFARKPPLFMQPGDICEVSVEGIGVLRNSIADEVT